MKAYPKLSNYLREDILSYSFLLTFTTSQVNLDFKLGYIGSILK